MENAGQEAEDNLADVRHGLAAGRVTQRGAQRAAVEATTREGERLTLEVEERGWRDVARPDEWHETLHGLLTARSALYKQSFADCIAAKLRALSQ
jgi:hypothetical protein